MTGIQPLEQIFWAIAMFLAVWLAIAIIRHESYGKFPFFFAYVLATLAQNVLFALSYRQWGFTSSASLKIAWGAQALVVSARALAVAEMCHQVLAKYRGVWKLAWRLLLTAATFILLYAWVASRGSWQFAILNLDRGLELAIACVIVVLFVFARYYGIEVDAVARMLATGFFLYSSFRVVDDTILERWLHHYAALWNLAGTLAFIASILLWSWALRQQQPETASEPGLLSESLYRTLAPEINARLKALNERLSHLRSVQGRRI